MTCNELIDKLYDLRQNGYGNVEIKICYQPNYPMEENVSDVVGFNGHTKEDEEKDRDAAIYLTGTDSNNYAPRRIFDTCCDDYLDEDDYVEYEDD